MSAKPSISISDLQSGAKRLNSCDADNKTSHSDQKSSFDSAALVPLEVLKLSYSLTHSLNHFYRYRNYTINMTAILMKYLVN